MFRVTGQSSFGKVADGFGSVLPLALDISCGRPAIGGISIDPTSEIDACWISFNGVSTNGGLLDPGDVKNYEVGTAFPATGQAWPIPPSSALLTRGHPIVGPIMGPVVAYPLYRWKPGAIGGGSINRAGGDPQARINLRVYEPGDNMPGITGRLPVYAGWSSGNSTKSVIIPIFGRMFVQVMPRSTAGGNLHVDFGWLTPGDPVFTGGLSVFVQRADIAVPAAPASAVTVLNVVSDFITFSEDIGVSTINQLTVKCYEQEIS